MDLDPHQNVTDLQRYDYKGNAEKKVYGHHQYTNITFVVWLGYDFHPSDVRGGGGGGNSFAPQSG